MFADFLHILRAAGVPVSVKEFLALLDALSRRVIEPDAEQFYYLCRAALVKDERYFDPFDRAFAHYFQGTDRVLSLSAGQIPAEWLRSGLERLFTPEEMARIEALGSWEDIMKTFAERSREQKEAHQGGNKWVGTGGTSPFGSGGYNPAGIRVGDAGKRRGSAVKVWDQRLYQGLAGDMVLDTRNIKMALRRLRRFTREGHPDELDLDGTIRDTARKGMMYDVLMRPSRRNAVKVLLFFDIGGSMTPHVRRCEQLFSSARTEFKHLETFYFHNCVYENVWLEEYRWEGRRATFDILHKYNRDYRLIIVGDASMSPYELLQQGGSVDHFNQEPGLVWLARLREAFPHSVWLNPEPREDWRQIYSISLVRSVFAESMFPLTLNGITAAINQLRRGSPPERTIDPASAVQQAVGR
ncbi:MAG: VWA domain-containing protein [Deltaproteobacteria bacterium]|nr:VWA domain-containing protein [Deltaproteobacteria bacterium]